MYYNKFDPYILPSPSTITDGKMTPQHARLTGLLDGKQDKYALYMRPVSSPRGILLESES